MNILCVRDYEFHILDNAFLVHRPGIKKYKFDRWREGIAGKQGYFVKHKLKQEYELLFGEKLKCRI